MSYFIDLFEPTYQELSKMSKKDMEEELTKFRALWTWLDSETRACLAHIRYPMAVVTREYHRFVGLMGAPHFTLDSIDLDVTEETYDFIKKRTTVELKTVNIKVSQFARFEYIHREEVIPDEEEVTDKREPVELENY